ncbi:MAG: MFS transporter [Pseudomonadota bacterium]
MPQPKTPSPTYRWYMVGVFMVAYIFSFIDRQILSLLVEPISADLQIDDAQFGLLLGAAFSLFYATMGIPVARLADSANRPLILTRGIAVWSACTAACGFASSFWQMFLARMGVGAGEGSLAPTVYSMIADSFPEEQLGRAYGVYSSGSMIGLGLAMIVGGAVAKFADSAGPVALPLVGLVKPWQLTFIVVGVPGILVALLIFLTIRDPERKGMLAGGDGTAAKASIGATLKFITKEHPRTFFVFFFGNACAGLSAFTVWLWSPAYFIRVFQMDTASVGLLLGLIFLIVNSAGSLVSGLLCDRFAAQGHLDAPVRAGLIGALGCIIPLGILPFVPSLPLAAAVFSIAAFFSAFVVAASTAQGQILAPNQMRGQVGALSLFVISLVALGLGMWLIGYVTEAVFQDQVKVGYSMALVGCSFGVLGVGLLVWGMGAYRQSRERINARLENAATA